MSNEAGHYHCVIPIDFKSTRSLADFKMAVLQWCKIGTVKELKRKTRFWTARPTRKFLYFFKILQAIWSASVKGSWTPFRFFKTSSPLIWKGYLHLKKKRHCKIQMFRFWIHASTHVSITHDLRWRTRQDSESVFRTENNLLNEK